MTHDVHVSRTAQVAINEYASYLATEQQAPQAASQMLERIWDGISSLETFPCRCPLAPENKFSKLEVRMLRVNAMLILFTASDDAKRVDVLAVRHGRQQPLTRLDR